MDWNEVYLTMQGIWQRDAGIRRGFYLVHRSLVDKPVDIMDEWPLPFDDHTEKTNTFERLKKRLLEYKQQHGAGIA